MKKYFLVEMELNTDNYPVSVNRIDEDWIYDHLNVLGVITSMEIEEVTERMAHNNYHKRSRKV